MSEPQWHYFHDRIVEGPKSQADLCDLFRSGAVPLDILVWNKALGDWKPAAEVDCFRGLRPAPAAGFPTAPLRSHPNPPPQTLSAGQGSGSYPPPPPPPPINSTVPSPITPAKKGRLLPILAGIVLVGAIIGAACYWFKPSPPSAGPSSALPAFIPLPTRAPGPAGDSSPGSASSSPSSASQPLLPTSSPLPTTSDVAEILNEETIEAFIHSYYEGVENKDVDRVIADYDAVVSCGPQGLRTRTAIRADMVSYFAQYRSLLISIEAVHLDIDPVKALAHVSFTIRYRKLPEQGTLDAGHGIEKWSIIVRNGKLAISSIEEIFFSAP